MARSDVLVGIDIGTTKVCTLVAEHSQGAPLRVLGVGLAPSQGVQKGVVTELDAATEAVASSLDKAERLSGYKIGSALLGIAGGHISCAQNRGSVPVADGHEIDGADIKNALEAARTLEMPSHKEILHVIPRQYIVDGIGGIKDPHGMTGFQLEVDTHIVTAHVGPVQNALKVMTRVGLEVDELVLQPLASAYSVLSEAERDLGVALIDIGGGTTDVAIMIEDAIWHTTVLPVGGNNITNDLAIVLGIPHDSAERLKVEIGHASAVAVASGRGLPGTGNTVKVETFGEGEYKSVSRELTREVIDSRLSEMFSMILTELRRSGYDDMLPAGVVLTGGGARMEGIAERAEKALGLPARVGFPTGLDGLGEVCESPAFSTAVGLPVWRARRMERPSRPSRAQGSRRSPALRIVNWFREFIP